MGRLDIFRKKKEMVYHFMYQRAGEKGWIPIDKYDSEITAENLEPMMTEAGTYALQKRVGGRIVGMAWSKKVEGVTEDEGEKEHAEPQSRVTDSDKIALAIESDMVRAVRWFKLPEMIQGAISKAFGTEGNPFPGSGGGKGETTATSIKDALKAMRSEYDEMDTIFGSKATTDDKKMPISGSIPAWLVYLPDMLDQAGDKIMSRLERIGLLGETKPKQKMFEMPDKPVHTKKLDLSSIKKDAKKKVEESGEKSEAK